MSSYLSGGSRAIRIDLEIVKSPSSTSTITSHSTSPSSTLSESSNSPLAISTRKPRTRRKRPNQTYNEAAALLSTANPNIFSTKNLTKPCKFTKPHGTYLDEAAELLLPFRVFDNSGFLLHHPIPEKPTFRIEHRVANCSEKPRRRLEDGEYPANLWSGCQEDFDAESILEEEIEEGIDSIIGNVEVTNEEGSVDESSFGSLFNSPQFGTTTCYGHPIGLGFGVKLDSCLGSMRRGVRSSRQGDDNCWRFPTVDVSGTSNKATAEKKKKKTEKLVEVKSLLESTKEDLNIPKQDNESAIPKSEPGLLLKLNYDSVANAWSDRGTPFTDDALGQEMSATGNDLQARLAQIDLFSENGGLREASVLRYKEKRRTRLFSKKIRYQVRKVNADQRPRMKGRFVRRPNSPMSESRQD